MSEIEKRFLRQLKITLIAVLGPFILAMIGSAISDHFMIRNNKEHIKAMQDNYVTRDIMLVYVNELRQLNRNLKEDKDKDVEQINDDLDKLMRDVYDLQRRGSDQMAKQQ